MGGAPMPMPPAALPPGAPAQPMPPGMPPPGAAPPGGDPNAMPSGAAPPGAPPGAAAAPPPPPMGPVDPSTGQPVPPSGDPNAMMAQGLDPASIQATPRAAPQRPLDSKDSERETVFLKLLESAKNKGERGSPVAKTDNAMLTNDKLAFAKLAVTLQRLWRPRPILKTGFEKLAGLGIGDRLQPPHGRLSRLAPDPG
jgi:hypothetical protein